MRRVEVCKDGKFALTDGDVEMVYEDKVTRFGHGAKVGCLKYVGRRAYVIVCRK
ncbi:MAG: DUF2080 family transposase-associated protein [Nitrososphaerota archaeon]|jgi:putative transposon-encoded protein|nr:DUF2080 family transposase-associated protein [Nitrososphaerota archaeon]